MAWYELNARSLPWRVPPAASRLGNRPDPYRIWLSEIMAQQTTLKAVIPYFERFTTAWPDVSALAKAEDEAVMSAWAGLGYYARARNLLRCARTVANLGEFPRTEAGLRELPGIGPYTAAAIASIAFDAHAVVVDGNVERVMARLHRVATPMPQAKPALRQHAGTLTPMTRAGDYAQGVMDLGAMICTPRNPACALCPWRDRCQARKIEDAESYPVKPPKKAKPHRVGSVYVARRRDGAILVETRPSKGLLGGMLGLPGSDWKETMPDHSPPLRTDWQTVDAPVAHVFTHFTLQLTVLATEVANETSSNSGDFRKISATDLPTVMRKALFAGLAILPTRDTPS